MNSGFNTPVLFIIFNRADLAEIVFSRIREVKPKQLFIAADGPRSGNVDDELNCAATRRIVLSMIDWDCNVETRFLTANEGPGRSPFNAISWFFNQVSEGIILEDDCLPSESFFNFCETLLAKYAEDHRIFQINGNLTVAHKNQDSFFFSKYPHIWGWATWARSWKLVKKNVDLTKVDEVIDQTGLTLAEINYWKLFFKTFEQDKHWDAQLLFAHFMHHKFSIFPKENMIVNIGFGMGATNTRMEPNFHRHLKLNQVQVTSYPREILNDNAFDQRHFEAAQSRQPEFLERLNHTVRSSVKTILQMIFRSVRVNVSRIRVAKTSKQEKFVRIYSQTIRINADHKLDDYIAAFPRYNHFIGILTRSIERKLGAVSFIDVGANVGDTAVRAALIGDTEVFCIEGNPFYLPYLQENTRTFGQRVKIIERFLAEFPSSSSYEIQTYKGTARLVQNPERSVDFTTIDELFLHQRLRETIILKLDTDGFDTRILLGAANFIAKHKPIIFIELDGSLTEDFNKQLIAVIQLLERNGYQTGYIFDNYGTFLTKTRLEMASFATLANYPKRSLSKLQFFDVCFVPNNKAIENAVDEITIHFS